MASIQFDFKSKTIYIYGTVNLKDVVSAIYSWDEKIEDWHIDFSIIDEDFEQDEPPPAKSSEHLFLFYLN